MYCFPLSFLLCLALYLFACICDKNAVSKKKLFATTGKARSRVTREATLAQTYNLVYDVASRSSYVPKFISGNTLHLLQYPSHTPIVFVQTNSKPTYTPKSRTYPSHIYISRIKSSQSLLHKKIARFQTKHIISSPILKLKTRFSFYN